jgi:nucleotide-binding universal stress UspA family protein
MKPVMLATDGSPSAQKATSAAINLARAVGTDLVVVSVAQAAFRGYGPMAFMPVAGYGDLTQLGALQAGRIAKEAAVRAEDAGVAAHRLVPQGLSIEQICLAAKEQEPLVLVIGSGGWDPLRRGIFGTVSTGVVHHASCPVLVVPEARPKVGDSKHFSSSPRLRGGSSRKPKSSPPSVMRA